MNYAMTTLKFTYKPFHFVSSPMMQVEWALGAPSVTYIHPFMSLLNEKCGGGEGAQWRHIAASATFRVQARVCIKNGAVHVHELKLLFVLFCLLQTVKTLLHFF